ncbi:MAG TPA: D-cysteine desulfhydrase family protein [Gemmataceae bacterium]|jgi:1-aminocyclopropane-1-carboxylate deaminase/D-cysteine desulfhydrase-like pyridoxal-dependent ACC family enzyme|nr:D-cysteine desulfhydrase family protein [Gemmataceae bacterium]
MPCATLSTDQLRQQAARLPRVPLAHLPTPLEEVPRFTKHLEGPRLFIKRDDCTGLLFGGNKTRHNEFLMGEALKQKADVVVWGAGVQSNNCRQTAAACNKLGLDCVLYLSRGVHNDDIQGNLLLDHLMGAEVHIVDEPMGPALDDLLMAKAAEMKQAGRKPFVWDRITGRPLAAVSYALCLAEILDQLRAQGVEPKTIYAAAAGATGGGLALGKAVLGWPGKIRLLCPIHWPWDTPADLADVATAGAALLSLPHRLSAGDIDVRTDYIGPRYGAVTPAGREALNLLARSEGILLDPVYTAKAMAGLIDDIRQRRLGPADTTVFIHTGGTPAVFAYRDELMES